MKPKVKRQEKKSLDPVTDGIGPSEDMADGTHSKPRPKRKRPISKTVDLKTAKVLEEALEAKRRRKRRNHLAVPNT